MSEWEFYESGTGAQFLTYHLKTGLVSLAHVVDDPKLRIGVSTSYDLAEQWISREDALCLGHVIMHWAKTGELTNKEE